MKRNVILLVFSLATLPGLVHGASQDSPSTAQQVDAAGTRLGDFVLSGMWDARDRLRSGVLHATHRTWRKGIEKELRKYFLAFDQDDRSLRYDVEIGSRFIRYARNTSDSLLFIKGTGGVVKHPADWEIDIPDAKPFDIFVMGAVSRSEFTYPWNRERLKQFLTEEVKLSEAVRESETLYRLAWSFEIEPVPKMKHEFQRTMWIDASKGFSPVRMEVVGTMRKDDGTSLNWTEAASETTWLQRSDVWVPSQCVMETKDASSRWEISLDWTSVNEQVNGELFRVEGLELPGGTLIVNERLGEPIVESRIGGPSSSSEPPQQRSWLSWAFIVLNVVVLAIGIPIWLIVRRRRRLSP